MVGNPEVIHFTGLSDIAAAGLRLSLTQPPGDDSAVVSLAAFLSDRRAGARSRFSSSS